MMTSTEAINDVEKQNQEADERTVVSNGGGSDVDDTRKVVNVASPRNQHAWLVRGALLMLAVLAGIICLVVFTTKQTPATTANAASTEKTSQEFFTEPTDAPVSTDATEAPFPLLMASLGGDVFPPFDENILKGYAVDEDFVTDASSVLERIAFQAIKRSVESYFGPLDQLDQQVGVAATKSFKSETSKGGDKRSSEPVRTNTVEATVDEADFVKADEHFVYASLGSYLLVWDRAGKKIAELEMPKTSTAATSYASSSGDDIVSSNYTENSWESRASIDAIIITDDYLVLSLSGFDSGVVDPLDLSLLSSPNNTQVRVYTKPTPSDTEIRFVGKKSLHGFYLDARFIEQSNTVHFVTYTNLNLYEALTRPLDSLLFVTAQGVMPPHQYIPKATAFAKDDLIPAVTEKLRKEFSREGMSKFLRINGWVLEDSPYPVDESAINTVLQVTSFNVNDITRMTAVGDQKEDEPELPVSEAAMLAPTTPRVFGSDDRLVLSFDRYFYDEKTFYNTDMVFMVAFDVASSRFSSIGSVLGDITDAYSMDIAGSDLRVATSVTSYTETDVNFTSSIDNYIIVLDMSSELMKERGRVSIGEPQEVIMAVHFGDNFSYAVTFNQQDPFYVLNFSDGIPAIKGTLKLPGYSTYLLPLSDTDNKLLVGIGQNATLDVDTGAVSQNGLMVNVFDVSNPNKPKVRASFQFDRTETVDSNAASREYKSVQYKDGKLTIPITSYPSNTYNDYGIGMMDMMAQTGSFDGFVVLDVSNGVRELFRVDHTATYDGACHACGSQFYTPRSFMYDDGTLMTIRNDIAVYSNSTSGTELWRMNLTVPASDMGGDMCCY